MVTMKEVALRAGVSRSTVSFALNDRQEGVRIPEETRRRILQAAVELGYKPNELARAVVTGKSRLVGIMSYDNDKTHVSEALASIMAGSLNEATGRGYATKLLVLPYFSGREDVRNLVERVISWRVDGILSVSLQDETVSLLQEEMEQQCPIAFIENYVRPTVPEDRINIATDDYGGILEAVQHLYQLGHRRISLLGGPVERQMTIQRNAMFLQVLSEFNLPTGPNSIIASHWSRPEIIEKSVHFALDLPERPTALLCAGDGTAMIATRIARQRGLSLPHDLSLIGFGNFNMALFADPPLTTIGQNFREMGRLAMQSLLDHIECKVSTPIQALVPASLVLRQSTAPPA